MVNDPQKSDGCTVAMKSANKPDGSGCGVDGAKAAGRGERGRVLHAPDTEPGGRVPGA